MRGFERIRQAAGAMADWTNRGAAAGLVGAAIGLGLTLAGCTTYQPRETKLAPAAVITPLPPDAWPARKTDKLKELAAATPPEIFTLLPTGQTLPPSVPEGIAKMLKDPIARVAYSSVSGPGILRVFDTTPGNEWRTGNASMRFVSYSERDDQPKDPRARGYMERQVRWWGKRLAELGGAFKLADPDTLRMLIEGTGIRVIEPTGRSPSRGTIVYIQGLGSSEWEQPMVDALRDDGWWLVKIATPRVWWYETRTYPIKAHADVPKVAQQLAEIMDDMVAEPAYAAEAALNYLAEHRPEVPQSPLVMLGCSCGALAAPTVVARMPDRFDAAVLIGGGANLLEISQTSDLTDGGIRLEWAEGTPRGPWRRELFREYLERSKLDPYYTAKFLRSRPTLIVQANLDMTVPAHNGWLLWDRAGRPDRYDHVGEHRTLFLTLGSQSNRIVQWLDEHAGKRAEKKAVVHGPEQGADKMGAGRASIEAR